MFLVETSLPAIKKKKKKKKEEEEGRNESENVSISVVSRPNLQVDPALPTIFHGIFRSVGVTRLQREKKSHELKPLYRHFISFV